jgi:hypothetical protein
MFDPLLTEPQNIGCQFSIHGGKALEKILQREAIGEIIEQRPDGNARAFEDWRAVKNLRVAGNERFRGHGHASRTVS